MFIAERRFISVQQEQALRNKSFTLYKSKEEINIPDSSFKTHPHFPVFINVGEQRILTGLNLLISINESSSDNNSVDISVYQIGENDQNLSLEQVELQENILSIGPDVKLALRKLRGDKGPEFHMVASKDIRIKSIEHLQQGNLS